MKANQKFVSGDDEAVSPVIAVILMVAITVVLAATVYVWVSGFGSQSGQPAKTISMSSAAALDTSGANKDLKQYSIASATSGMKWSDVTFSLNGQTMNYDNLFGAAHTYCVALTGSTCVATATWTAGGSTGNGAVISAGQILQIHDTAGSLSGETFRVLDSQANSVILTLVVG